jgi:hypothetical protein
MKDDDLVLSVMDEDTSTAAKFKNVVLSNCTVGHTYKFTVKRYGGSYNLQMLIGARGLAMRTLKIVVRLIDGNVDRHDLANVKLLRKLKWFE